MKHILLILICTAFTCTFAQNKLPQWREGEMEIHHIYTGRGECTFLILPDGTTMLIGAGDAKATEECQFITPHIKTPVVEKITSYIKALLPAGTDSIDYLLASNLNPEQIGGLDEHTQHTNGREPDYFLTGIPAICEKFHFSKLIDRDFPIYNYPIQNLKLEAKNYVNFIRYQTLKNHLQAEHFDVGRNTQITLRKKPQKYGRYFQILNLAASGNIWTGKGLNSIPLFALKHNFKYRNNENTMSIAIRINYGSFSYYTGGDLAGNIEWRPDSITGIDHLVGRTCGKVDVCKANNGCSAASNSQEFIQHVKAKNYIVMPWNDKQLDPVTMERLITSEEKTAIPQIFSTQYPEKYNPLNHRYMWGDHACPHTGNIVVKVTNKGKSYKIYVVDDELKIKAKY